MGQWVRFYALAASPARRRLAQAQGSGGGDKAEALEVPRTRPVPQLDGSNSSSGGNGTSGATPAGAAFAGSSSVLPLPPALKHAMESAQMYYDAETAPSGVVSAAQPGTLDAVRLCLQIAGGWKRVWMRARPAAAGEGGLRMCWWDAGQPSPSTAPWPCRRCKWLQVSCCPALPPGHSTCLAKTWWTAARVRTALRGGVHAPCMLLCCTVCLLPAPNQGACLQLALPPALGTVYPLFLPPNPVRTLALCADAFPGADHIRFPTRVVAKGPDWLLLERPLPYDLRVKWDVSGPARPWEATAQGGREGAGSCVARGLMMKCRLSGKGKSMLPIISS